MNDARGMSLIELLIVGAIILVIAAIAVPNLMKSKMNANEASAAAALKTVGTANATYSSAYNIGFAGSLGALGPPAAGTAASSVNADVIDSALAGGVGGSANTTSKNGYNFTYSAPAATPTTAVPNNSFSVVAVPILAGTSGRATFCMDQSGVIKKDASGTATAGATTGCAAFAGNPM